MVDDCLFALRWFWFLLFVYSYCFLVVWLDECVFMVYKLAILWFWWCGFVCVVFWLFLLCALLIVYTGLGVCLVWFGSLLFRLFIMFGLFVMVAWCLIGLVWFMLR